ncbi:RNA-binding cell elongation regulator Jag/EloR [Desulfobacula toluolica]|uniref:RNA-binding protein KhpB n=1 Tax=Desulfobacula toluolica (strain DSM 7467 / Tol2) TaxID=651182 RepID=K0NT82_DESTT|nr:RNA-binding cell elongation regulator Jag/EloR [Desulfobacula toluolica]CCK82262.1 single-stranded nucleic acid binding R3H domain protein [Desulfobacula toluolica Tol2]
MTQTQEFSGKDVDVAIKNACAELMLSKKELKYDVISEGSSGIFGIVGRKDARIRVVLPNMDTDKSDEAEMEGIRSIVDEAFGEDTRLEETRIEKPKTEEPRIEEPKSENFQKKEFKSYDTPDPVDVSEDSIAIGIEAVQKMADLITDDATVSANTDQDRLTLKIEGGNAGILIGRKGQTLDAMQFLTDKIINRKSDARVRVKVDIEGYMETRKSNLRHLAYKMADKAKKTGRPATINQMSAQDRRIVHLALKDDASVRTQSMGDGYYRRLVIFPKKKNSFRGKRRFKR